MTDRDRQRVTRMERVYRDVPAVACRGLCAEACGPILMTPLEGRRLALPVRPPSIDDPCPLLDGRGRCSAYERRPLICRLYGAAEGLPCPHGCEVVRKLTEPEVGSLMARARAIGGDGVFCTHSLSRGC